jgi:NADH:ubiquinone oxidoreductase subunit 4 (subunit M)
VFQDDATAGIVFVIFFLGMIVLVLLIVAIWGDIEKWYRRRRRRTQDWHRRR